jgi:D-alanine-D-alanine ligase
VGAAAGQAFRHIAVLMGGRSAEREVSLVSGEACARALESRGFRVTRVDVDDSLPRRLLELRPDCCFNALHGRFGEDGRVQGLLDLLAIPYTHSGVLASALAMDKPMAIRVFRDAGLRCPEGLVTTLGRLLDEGPPLDGPIVVKPAAEGSSVGVHILPTGDVAEIARRNDLDRGQRILVERYVPGRELTAAVLGSEPLAVTEIAPKEGFYDYRAKYTEGCADHLVPAPLPQPIYRQVLDWALRAHEILGCRGVSRADFRYDPTAEEGQELFLLEVNTQPGMTPLSLVPEQAAYRGIPFGDLVARLVAEARCDQ